MVLNAILKNVGPRDTVLHIGPGILYNKIRYSATAAKIVIAEPDLDLALALKSRAASQRSIEIIEKAVQPEGRRAELHQFNFSMLNSLRQATGLQQLFPGLRQTGVTTVDGLSVPHLLEKMSPEHDSRDLLIVDALGEDMDLLKSFEAASVLTRFSDIVLRSTKHVVFAQGAPTKTVIEWLGQRHYDRPITLENSDPDFPILYFSRNPLGEKLQAQYALLESLRTDQEDLRDQFDQLRSDKRRQDALLQQVTQRLIDAADYLQLLSDDSAKPSEPTPVTQVKKPSSGSGGGAKKQVSPKKPTAAQAGSLSKLRKATREAAKKERK